MGSSVSLASGDGARSARLTCEPASKRMCMMTLVFRCLLLRPSIWPYHPASLQVNAIGMSEAKEMAK